jgi:SP family arabinose:H+ symporter-like MFS transporter
MPGAEVLPAALLLGLLSFVPESPRWLIQAGRETEARAILVEVAGPEMAEYEIRAARSAAAQETGRFRELFQARFRQPLFVAVGLMAFSQFCGINAIMYYSTKIFTTAGIGVQNAFMASAIVGLVNLAFTGVAIAFVDRAGRRVLLLVGLTFQVIALGAVGWMFRQGIAGLPLLVVILVFIAAFAMAMGPIPWILCAEIFPTRLRGRAMSVATFTIWSSCYVVAQSFPMLNDSPSIGPARTFWIYAGFSLAALVFVLVGIRETKGRTLEEIEAMWTAPPRPA